MDELVTIVIVDILSQDQTVNICLAIFRFMLTMDVT